MDHPDQTTANEPAKPDADDDADDNADDDFEAFEEGGDVYDDDFGAFDEGEQELAKAEQNSPAITSPPAPRLELVSRTLTILLRPYPFSDPATSDKCNSQFPTFRTRCLWMI